jgi:hypothetical protein
MDRSITRKILDVDSIVQEIKHMQYKQIAGHAGERPFIAKLYSDRPGAHWTLVKVAAFRDLIRRIVQQGAFNTTIAFLILLHAVYIGLETEFVDSSSGFILEWYLAELTFTTLFLLELILRVISTTRSREFVRDAWNIFDAGLVIVSCVDVLFFTFVSRSGRNIFVGAFRTLRLVRVARMVRLLRFFREMWVLVAGIIEAMGTLFWTWILVLVIIYVFGVFATRTIGQPNQSESELQIYFGNVPRSMFTLFQVTTTDGWADIARKATWVTQRHYYIVHRLSLFFGVWSLVSQYAWARLRSMIT